MKQILRLAILAGALIAASATLMQTAARAKVADTSKGKALVDAKGMTLYTFERDTAGKPACNSQCAQNRPPLMAARSDRPPGERPSVAPVPVNQANTAGSGPTRPEAPSRRSMARLSSASSWKSKTSIFSRMREGVTDFGITTKPLSRCQRRMT